VAVGNGVAALGPSSGYQRWMKRTDRTNNRPEAVDRATFAFNYDVPSTEAADFSGQPSMTVSLKEQEIYVTMTADDKELRALSPVR
jgi:hypothetical protein